jgi:hypothetical protein
MMSKVGREAKAVVWLQRLRDAEAAKEPLVAYARRHGLKPGEAYRWKKNLRGVGRWPAHSSSTAKPNPPKGLPKMSPRFARVRIVKATGDLDTAAVFAIIFGEWTQSRTGVEQ